MLDFLHRHTSRYSIMISVPLKHYLIEIQCHYTLMFEDGAILQTWKILSMLYIEEYREPWRFLQVGDRPEMLKGKTPDLFSFTVTGLNDIVNKHGGKSSQAQDAQTLISDFITKVTTSCRNIYRWLSMARTPISRSSRSLEVKLRSCFFSLYNKASLLPISRTPDLS